MPLPRYLPVACTALLLAGCASQPMAPPTASLDVIQTLRGEKLPAMRVGDFVPAPSMPPSMDKSVVIRSLVLDSPYDESFAKYLGKALEADLRAGSEYDANSGLVVSGQLEDSRVDSGLSIGSASLQAKFALTRDGKTVFEKELSVSAHWDSTFLGVVAIPDAANQYASLYGKLVTELLTDGDFRAAASSPAH